MEQSKTMYFYLPKDAKTDEKTLLLKDFAKDWSPGLLDAIQNPSDLVTAAMDQLSGPNRWDSTKKTLNSAEIPPNAALTLAVLAAVHTGDKYNIPLVKGFFDPDAAKKALKKHANTYQSEKEVQTALRDFLDTPEHMRETRRQTLLNAAQERDDLLAMIQALEEREKMMDLAVKKMREHCAIETIESFIGTNIPELFKGTTKWDTVSIIYEMAQKQGGSDGASGGSSRQGDAKLPGIDPLIDSLTAGLTDVKHNAKSVLAVEFATGKPYTGDDTSVCRLRDLLTDIIYRNVRGEVIEGFPHFNLGYFIVDFVAKLNAEQFPVFGMGGYEFSTHAGNPQGMAECRSVIQKASQCVTRDNFAQLAMYIRCILSKVCTNILITRLKAWFDKTFPEQNGTQAATATMFFLCENAGHVHTRKRIGMHELENFYQFIDEKMTKAIITPVVAGAQVKIEGGAGQAWPKSAATDETVILLDSDSDEAPSDAKNDKESGKNVQVETTGKRKAEEKAPDEPVAKRAEPIATIKLAKTQKKKLVTVFLDEMNDFRELNSKESERPPAELDSLRQHMKKHISGIVEILLTHTRTWPAAPKPPATDLLELTNYSCTAALAPHLAKMEGTFSHPRLRFLAFSIETLMIAFKEADIPCPVWCSVDQFASRIDAEVKEHEASQSGGQA